MTSLLSSFRLVSCVALAIAVVSCGDDVATETDGSTAEESVAPGEQETAEAVAPETSVADAPVASDAVAATVAPESLPQPEETPAPAPSRADLVLRSNGVGSSDFGLADIDVIPVVTALLGNPVDDRLGEYPTYDDEYNTYVDFEDTGFLAPFGRTTCYDNQFCLHFGGDTSDDVRFVGWSQNGFDSASAPLVTADGVTIGSRYADHLGVMTVNEGGCFTQGSGEIAGVVLLVSSESVPFSSFDDAGNYVGQTPDPADIVVTSLQAGDEPLYLFADC